MEVEADKVVAQKLEQEKERLENYNIVDGFAFYKGAQVDYTQIKLKFEERVKKLVEKSDEKLIKGEEVKEDEEVEVKEKDKTKKEGEETTIGVVKTSIKSVLQSIEDTKSISGFISEVTSPAARIGIYLNLNGTSKTRKNIIFLSKKAFKIDELTAALLLEDKTKGEKEKTDRTKITIERIQACYAEETRIFLTKNEFLTKFPKLKNYGFTKSFYCYDVIKDRRLAKAVYSELLFFTKTWTGRGNPKRFADKMKKYYLTVLNKFADVFEEVEVEYASRGIHFTNVTT